jgi:hypothetical protein
LENYTALLAAEDVVDLAAVKRMHDEDPTASAAILEARRVSPLHGMHAAVVWHLFFPRDGSGRTFAQRWEQAGFPGLKNDERVFFSHKMKMRIALLEVHSVLDEQSFEAVDLLDPATPPMIFVDRSMAAQAVRFFTCLTWVYPLPHFWRVSGTAISTSDLGPFSSLEMIEACVVHLGGPVDAVARKRWLAENFVLIEQALTATGLERRRQMLAVMDVSWGGATYELCASFGAARKALSVEPAVIEDDLSAKERAQGFSQAMVWFDDQPSISKRVAEAAAGRTVLGRVLLGKKEWRLEAAGDARLARLRASFELRMGAKVKFSRERRDNLAGQMAAKDPAPNLALVPPRLLEEPSNFELSSLRMPEPPAETSREDHFAGFLREHRRKWMDQPLPAFNGRSPREAVRDPELRTQVIELVKGHVRQVDRDNLKTGRTDDINELIRELGLAEIDFPPPPRRKAPSETEDDAQDENDATGNDVEFGAHPRNPVADRLPAPQLRDRPLTFDAAVERLERALGSFDLAADAFEELADSGATIVDDMNALTEGVLNETEFNFLLTFVFQAWFALVPIGVRAPRLNFDEMAADFDRDNERIAASGSAAVEALENLGDSSRQPDLLTALMAGLMDAAKRTPKKMRPSPAGTIGMLLALKALVDELDRALRRP